MNGAAFGVRPPAVPNSPELRPYRLGVYSVYALICCALFFLLLRSVIGDLYGKRAPSGPQQTPTACLEDLERLYGQLSARAAQPAPGGLGSDSVAREWDQWSRRWDDEVSKVDGRCGLGEPKSPAEQSLARALEGIEELRRQLSQSGAEAAEDARRVREALATARSQLQLK